MIKRLKKWVFSLQGKFILVASVCILIFTVAGGFIILSREENLYKQDITNQGKLLSEIRIYPLVFSYQSIVILSRYYQDIL